MDEVLELVDVVAVPGVDGIFVWFLRLVGLLAVLIGLGLWLLTDAGLLVLPLALIVGGLALVIVSGVHRWVAELFG